MPVWLTMWADVAHSLHASSPWPDSLQIAAPLAPLPPYLASPLSCSVARSLSGPEGRSYRLPRGRDESRKLAALAYVARTRGLARRGGGRVHELPTLQVSGARAHLRDRP